MSHTYICSRGGGEGVITGRHKQAGDCIDGLAHTSTQHNEKKSNSAKTSFVVEQSEVGEPH